MNNPSIAIIGAGYSGLSLALYLYYFSDAPLDIFICDNKNNLFLGAAYSSTNPSHLLNVEAEKMSAYDFQPDHFVAWLRNNPDFLNCLAPIDIAKQYVPRVIYGHYLKSLATCFQKPSPAGVNVKIIPHPVIAINKENNFASLALGNGHNIAAHQVILAYGNLPPSNIFFANTVAHTIANPWNTNAIKAVPANAPVVIIGSGLTMVDTVLSLLDQQHRGKIYAVSRRGLLPATHQTIHQPFPLHAEEIPKNLKQLIRYLRNKSEAFMETGGDWRAVINSLRPYTQLLWQQFTVVEKKRFLRHLLPYWDIHRHRMAPQVAARINAARTQGQLKIMKGRPISVQNYDMKIQFDYIINCTGPASITQLHNTHPLLNNLMTQQLVHADPLGIGIAVAPNCAVLNSEKKPSDWLFALGPPTRGTFWECTAIPDIRRQSYSLAMLLLANATQFIVAPLSLLSA